VRDSIRLAACQPYVGAYFNFLLFDEPRLAGWQSGAFWADRTPKDSLPAFRDAISDANAARVDCGALKGGRPSPDFMPPSIPADLAAVSSEAPLGVELTWSASSDELSSISYRVYRNGVQVGTASGTAWTDNDFAASTTYTYTVRALDSAGNLGGASTAVTVTTPAGGSPPTPPPPASPPPPSAPPPPPPLDPQAPPPPEATPATSTRGQAARTRSPQRRTGTGRGDVLRGTPGRDVLRGLGGADRLYGLGGNDLLFGGRGRDRLHAGPGRDVVYAADGARDTIACGAGRDVVHADRADDIDRDCELVRRSGRRR
jgi:Ca2+-binding RTX toxin-like protein